MARPALSDRKRLAALLGMLGSTSSGERDNAARLAEQFRQRLGLTWEELLSPDHVDDPASTRQENRPEPTRRRREEQAQPPRWGHQQAIKTGRSKFFLLEPRRVRCPHLWNNVRSGVGDCRCRPSIIGDVDVLGATGRSPWPFASTDVADRTCLHGRAGFVGGGTRAREKMTIRPGQRIVGREDSLGVARGLIE